MTPLILDLYSLSGNFSRPWKEAGYDVLQVDIKPGPGIQQVVRLMDWVPNRKVLGIIACPPCNKISKARGKRPTEAEFLESVSCFDAVSRMVLLYNPVFWVFENPFHSAIRRFYGPPRQRIRMSWFGFPASKETGLWGDFEPVKSKASDWNPVRGAHGTNMIGDLGSRKLRAETPELLGIRFFEAQQKRIR